MLKKIYGIYDREENCVFTGTRQECIDYIHCTKSVFAAALSRGNRIKRKYTVVYLLDEEITERTCSICNEKLPIERMYHKKYGDEYLPMNMCYECYLERLKMLRRRKKK